MLEYQHLGSSRQMPYTILNVVLQRLINPSVYQSPIKGTHALGHRFGVEVALGSQLRESAPENSLLCAYRA